MSLSVMVWRSFIDNEVVMSATAVRYGCTMLAGTNKKGMLKPLDGGYYRVPAGAYNAYNSMGMFYDANSALPLLKPGSGLMRQLEKGVLRGEYKHPERDGMSDREYIARIRKIDDDREAFHIRAIEVENSVDEKGRPIFLVFVELRPSGPYGHLVKDKLDNPHENCYLSVRSLTMDDVIRGVKYTREIVTWDYVGEGGIYVANKYNAPSLESYHDVEVQQHDLLAIAAEQRRDRQLGLESNTQDLGPLLKQLGWDIQTPTPPSISPFLGW